MPVVPKYQGGVQSQGLPSTFGNAQPSLEAFGGGQATAQVTDAAQSLISDTQKLVLEEKKKADDLAVSEYWSKLNQYQNDRIYNSKDGLMTRRGKDSFGAADEFNTGFNQYADKLDADILKNEDQRIAAKKVRDKEYLDFDNKIQTHLYKERTAYDEEVTKTGIEAAKNDAILNFQVPGKVAQSVSFQENLIREHAKRTGKGDDWVKTELAKGSSDIHSGVVERMLAQGNDQSAEAYYKANKAGFTGDDATKIEKALEIGSTLGGGQRAADAAWQKYKGDYAAAADHIYESLKNKPKVREKALDVLRERATLSETARKQSEERILRQAHAIIENNVKTGENNQPDPSQLAKLQPEQLQLVDRYRSLVAQGIQPKTVWSVRESLMKMASDPKTRDKFRELPISQYRLFLDDGDMGKMLDLQTAIRNGDEKTVKEFLGIVSDDKVVSDAIQILQDSNKISTNEQANYFRQVVEKEAFNFHNKTKRRPNNDELRSIINGLTVQVVTKRGFFYDDKKMVYQLQAGETGTVTKAEQIPQALRASLNNIVLNEMTVNTLPKGIVEKIRAELKREGRRGLDSEVLERFKAARTSYMDQDMLDEEVVKYYNKNNGGSR